MDDASTSETKAVCASFPDIQYLRLEQQRGVGFARAAGIEASTAEFISFLDDDDARLPGSVDRQLAVFDTVPEAALVYGQVYLASETVTIDRQPLYPQFCASGDVFWTLIGYNFIPSVSAVVRRSAIDAVGGLCHEAGPADDWDLWLRISERYPIATVPEPVVSYRKATLWSKQGSSRLADGLLDASMRVLERCATLPRAKADPRAFRLAKQRMRRRLCLHLMGEAFDAARHGDSYVFVSLQHALATPDAFVHSLFSAQAWRKLRERLGS